ncbi:hypothetical protein OC835_006215 [Tilletia horrida]|nr:hypothetical protein OC835_006215 [Tilletia horrida]
MEEQVKKEAGATMTRRRTIGEHPNTTKKASTKTKATYPSHNANPSSGMWARVYRFVLNLVIDSPTNSRGMALRAMRTLVGPLTPKKGKAKDTDVNLLGLANKNHFRKIWTYRKEVALDQFKPGKFWTTPDIEGLKETTQEQRAAERRWIALAHALGDLAILPLLMFFGDTFSFDFVRRLHDHKFGAFMDFLQTGNDGRDDQQVWADDTVEAMIREAARAAAKWLGPTMLAEIVT